MKFEKNEKTRINSITWLEYWREDLPYHEEVENVHWNSQNEILDYLQNKYHARVLKFSVDFYASQQIQPEDSVELRHLSVDTELSDISESELWNFVWNERYMEKHASTVDSEKFEGRKAIGNATEACGGHKSVWKPFEEDGKRFVHIETWNVVLKTKKYNTETNIATSPFRFDACISADGKNVETVRFESYSEAMAFVQETNKEGSEINQKILRLAQKKIGSFKEIRTFLVYPPETFENTDAIRKKVFDIFTEK